MHDSIQGGELLDQAKRLRNFRLPLALVLMVNIVLIMRVPMPELQQAKAHESAEQVSQNSSAPVTARRFVPPVLPDGVLVVGTDQAASNQHEATEADVEPVENTPVEAAAVGRVGATATELATRAWAHLPEMTLPVEQWRQTAGLAAERWVHSAHDAIEQLNNDSWQPPHESEHDSSISAQSSDRVGQDDRLDSTAATSQHDMVPALHDTLAIRNPAGNGETVRFLVNERLYELLPGEAHRFARTDLWLIRFHRGGEFGDVEKTLADGAYRFAVTSRGWDLIPDEPPVHALD